MFLAQQQTLCFRLHLSLIVPPSFVQLTSGHMCPFLCCGTRKETYCREEGESLQHLPGNNDSRLPLTVSLAGCVRHIYIVFIHGMTPSLTAVTLIYRLIDSLIHQDFSCFDLSLNCLSLQLFNYTILCYKNYIFSLKFVSIVSLRVQDYVSTDQ